MKFITIYSWSFSLTNVGVFEINLLSSSCHLRYTYNSSTALRFYFSLK